MIKNIRLMIHSFMSTIGLSAIMKPFSFRLPVLTMAVILIVTPVFSASVATAEEEGSAVQTMSNGKTQSTYYTPEKVANARRNIENYDWAKVLRDQAVDKAKFFVELDDEFLWQLPTSQALPRSLGVLTRYKQRVKGSPGPDGSQINKFGNYPWIIDPINNPWKLKSPVTGELYPTNDFKSYYESGLNERGEFDPVLARQRGSQYLKNELYPERGETWGVDDGWGWKDGDGDVWTFIAYYNHWANWVTGGGQATYGYITRGLDALRNAYLYTGDTIYAHKGMILLDRIADLYPDMDITAHNWYSGFDNGDPKVHSGQGKIVHDIWETGNVKTFTLAYDAFYPAIDQDSELLAFLRAKSEQYELRSPKQTQDDIKRNIEDNILRLIYPGVQNSQIRGNIGMHQSALALAAVVLDEEGTSKEWLDFVFKPGKLIVQPDPNAPFGRKYMVTGGNFDPLFYNDVDRDGWGNEASPGYNMGWLSNFLIVADAVDGYERYPEYDLFKNPKFLKMFKAYYPIIMLDNYTPTIGDTGKTGSPGLISSLANDLLGFEKTGDPVLAQLSYKRNGNKTAGLHGSIFSAEPEKIVNDIEEVIRTKGPFHLDSTHSTGFGFSALRDGNGSSQRGLWSYYGRNTGHGHLDTLNIGLHAFGVDLSPDLGYPEVTGTDPERMNWTSATVSHNAVVVDRQSQKNQVASIVRHIDETENVKLIDIEAPKLYAQTELYKRTTAMIRADEHNSYAVDFFRIKGGSDHVFSFHGAEGVASSEGLELTPQNGGSYAGEDVPLKDPEFNKNGLRGGFNYLSRVERDNDPSSAFSVDWSIKDTWNVHPQDRDIHLRLTMLGETDDVALADGVPPQNKPGNPETLRYMLAHRNGDNLESNFTSVLEPYEDKRFITDIREVPVLASGNTAAPIEAKAVKVTLQDGRVDYIVSALNGEIKYMVDGKFEFQGSFGVVSYRNDTVVYTYMHDASLLKPNQEPTQEKLPSVVGTVDGFTKELSEQNEMVVDMVLHHGVKAEDLVGKFIHVETDGVRNASYEIKSIDKAQGGHRYTIRIGDITFIRGMKDSNDRSQGYIYDFNEGAAFTIPLTYETKIDES
ncbi:MAG: Heparinase family protein [Paenibacillus sp.]|nr:Heparinase family protein [Paenibacillus sp.]